MSTAVERLQSVRSRVNAACERCGRIPSEVCLLAVSKRFPSEVILPVWEAGQVDFGESRQQEGADKVRQLPSGIHWHFIGKLQRNKVRKVLEDFTVIHGVDSLKLASHIDRIAGELGRSPQVYLEVNQGQEENKGGFSPADLEAQLGEILSLTNLELLGLMTIPPFSDTPEGARPWFQKLRKLRDELEASHDCSLPGLSMGMSGDFEVAIEEGATVVRVGSEIFGARPALT